LIENSINTEKPRAARRVFALKRFLRDATRPRVREPASYMTPRGEAELGAATEGACHSV
jgi:hypothetical protein